MSINTISNKPNRILELYYITNFKPRNREIRAQRTFKHASLLTIHLIAPHVRSSSATKQEDLYPTRRAAETSG
jgi:hypothetical protein